MCQVEDVSWNALHAAKLSPWPTHRRTRYVARWLWKASQKTAHSIASLEESLSCTIRYASSKSNATVFAIKILHLTQAWNVKISSAQCWHSTLKVHAQWHTVWIPFDKRAVVAHSLMLKIPLLATLGPELDPEIDLTWSREPKPTFNQSLLWDARQKYRIQSSMIVALWKEFEVLLGGWR